jgi:hypothetical protein
MMRRSTDLFDSDPLDVGAYTVVVRVLTEEEDMGGQSRPLDRQLIIFLGPTAKLTASRRGRPAAGSRGAKKAQRWKPKKTAMHILDTSMMFNGWCKHLSGVYSPARTLSSTPPSVGPHDQSYAPG